MRTARTAMKEGSELHTSVEKFSERRPGCLTLPSSSEPEVLRVPGRERDDDVGHLGIARAYLTALTVEQPRPSHR